MAGGQSNRPAVRQNTGKLGIFKIASFGSSQCLMKVQCYCSVTNAFQLAFLGVCYQGK